MAREKIAVGSMQSASRFPAVALETLAGNRTITLAEVERQQMFFLDPGGSARTVTLPPEEACKGVVLYISNEADAAEIITINNDAAAAVCTPTQNEAAVLFCNGAIWSGLVGATS